MPNKPPDEILAEMYRLLDGLYVDRLEVHKLVKLAYDAGYAAGKAEVNQPPPAMYRYPMMPIEEEG